jgi:hypothetical protein
LVLAGDIVYVWENLDGHSRDGAYVPIGHIAGSTTETLLCMDRMFHAVDGDTHRVIPYQESFVF